jgi:hypothetical protein
MGPNPLRENHERVRSLERLSFPEIPLYVLDEIKPHSEVYYVPS